MLIKEAGCQTRSRLTEKLAKVQKNAHASYYIATPEEIQIDSYAYENGMSNVLLKDIQAVNPVVMNCKIRHS